ncbi:MAG: hypothetical protein AUG75_19815 [Cyanobacteria bacterium 13_1_20CM_4_61_6]|nr:MAG: hypothetical protein AUG75_19815 [Cyanobacteria bacterium 13_1_20CM_4_61_6]
MNTFTFSGTPDAFPSLGRNNVHIWRIALGNNTAEKNSRLTAVLSADERARAARYHFDEHRDSFIESRAALRSIIATYADLAAADVEFNYGPHGKPHLAPALNEAQLQFSFSRREGLAVVALARDRDVGIDVEFIRDDFPTREVAKEIFSEREFEEFLLLPAVQRVEGFYNCWTRKEAYIKAIGEGLSFPLKDFDVSLTPMQPARLLKVRTRKVGSWMLHDLKVENHYVAAVAVALCN